MSDRVTETSNMEDTLVKVAFVENERKRREAPAAIGDKICLRVQSSFYVHPLSVKLIGPASPTTLSVGPFAYDLASQRPERQAGGERIYQLPEMKINPATTIDLWATRLDSGPIVATLLGNVDDGASDRVFPVAFANVENHESTGRIRLSGSSQTVAAMKAATILKIRAIEARSSEAFGVELLDFKIGKNSQMLGPEPIALASLLQRENFDCDACDDGTFVTAVLANRTNREQWAELDLFCDRLPGLPATPLRERRK